MDTYHYDDANRLDTVNGVTYTWDNNGNLLSDGVNSYTYDAANRLIALSGQQSAFAYAYNGLGNRLQQTIDSQALNYSLDINTALPNVLSDGTSTYTFGLGNLSQSNATQTGYFLGDVLGSTRQLADGSGQVGLTQGFDPFGNPAYADGSGNSIFGYAGQQTDASGLQYLRARYYQPTEGRFISRDTFPGYAELPQSLNQFTYGLNDPVRYTDPSGNCPWCILGGIGFVVGAGGNLLHQLHQNGGNWQCVQWGQVLLWGGAGAVAGLTLGLLAAPPAWLMAGYFLAANTPLIAGTFSAVGAIGEIYLGGQALRGDPNAVGLLTGGWIVTGQSGIASFLSGLQFGTIPFSLPSFGDIVLGDGQATVQGVTALFPSVQYVGALNLPASGIFGLGAGSYLMMSPKSGWQAGGSFVPGWVRNGNTFVSWLKTIEADYRLTGRTLTRSQIDEIVKLARQYNVSMHGPEIHPKDPVWNVWHINFGTEGQAHIPVPPNYTLP